MQEVEIGGAKYRTGHLTAFEQFHVFRKLAPLFSGMGESFTQMPDTPRPAAGATAVIPPGFWSSMAPVATAIAEMSQADSEFIIKTCLSKCTRLTEQGTWARVTAANGEPMFEDIDLMTMLNLAFAVVQDNFAGFFSGPAPNGMDRGASPSPSPLSR